MGTNENPAEGNGRVSKISARRRIQHQSTRFDRGALIARRSATKALDILLGCRRYPDLDEACPPVSLREVA